MLLRAITPSFFCLKNMIVNHMLTSNQLLKVAIEKGYSLIRVKSSKVDTIELHFCIAFLRLQIFNKYAAENKRVNLSTFQPASEIVCL